MMTSAPTSAPAPCSCCGDWADYFTDPLQPPMAQGWSANEISLAKDLICEAVDASSLYGTKTAPFVQNNCYSINDFPLTGVDHWVCPICEIEASRDFTFYDCPESLVFNEAGDLLAFMELKYTGVPDVSSLAAI